MIFFDKVFFIASVLFVIPSVEAAFSPSYFDLDVAKKRCTVLNDKPEKLIYEDDFKLTWYDFSELADEFERLYPLGKRLPSHATYDPEKDQFFLYYKSEPVAITSDFIASVTRHIEMAMETGFASFVFYLDMGHAHFYFPGSHWRKHYMDVPLSVAKYEKMLADPKLKLLYHLSERLRFLDEGTRLVENGNLLFKHRNRNFVVRNNTSEFYETPVEPEPYNTVRTLPGHMGCCWFTVHASRESCFPYRDKDGSLRYFDISLYYPVQTAIEEKPSTN